MILCLILKKDLSPLYDGTSTDGDFGDFFPHDLSCAVYDVRVWVLARVGSSLCSVCPTVFWDFGCVTSHMGATTLAMLVQEQNLVVRFPCDGHVGTGVLLNTDNWQDDAFGFLYERDLSQRVLLKIFIERGDYCTTTVIKTIAECVTDGA